MCMCLIYVISPYSNGAVQIRVGLELADFHQFQSYFCQIFGSAKTDQVRFKWGFGEALLKDNFASYTYEEKTACKTPIFKAKRVPFKKPFKLDRVSFSTPEIW